MKKSKLFVVTVWDKDIKRWYNYHYDNKEENKTKRAWWINSRFEDYKVDVRKTINDLKTQNGSCEYIRFFLTSFAPASIASREYGVKDIESVKKNFRDRLFTNKTGIPTPYQKRDIRNYINQQAILKSKLGVEWLEKIKDDREFYFYCSEENFIDVKNEVSHKDWQTTMGEDFILNYNTRPENLLIVTLDDDNFEEYRKGESTDFTIFGFGDINLDINDSDWVEKVNWVFALGVELDPQKEALLFNFSFRNLIIRDEFNQQKEQNINLIEENYKRKLNILCKTEKRINGSEILNYIERQQK